MPIYEYQCGACGHTLETLQKISEPPLTTCPACGAEALKKLISASAFRLKGGGWYETDFKTGSKKNVAQADKGGDSQSKPAATGSAAATKKSGSS
jgi:putative FmdB family regulatory protein